MADIITIQNVRGYEKDGIVYLNVEDVARGLGFTQIAASGNEVVRWERVNKYLADFNFVPTCGDGVKANDFIPENIFYRLAMKAKNEVAEKFQSIVADEILPTIRKTGSYSVPKQFQGNEVELIGKIAEDIQDVFSVQRGIALSQAVDIVSVGRNLDLSNLKKLLPSAEHETGFLNVTQVGQKMGGLRANVVNRMLEELSLQYKENDCWRITDLGMEYGEEMPFTRNGHSGYQIRWNDKVVDYLKEWCMSK